MINGIINVYKEKGFTSHDVVAKLRGILKQKKIGAAFTWNCHRYPGYHRNRSVQASRNLLPGGGRKGHFVICW